MTKPPRTDPMLRDLIEMAAVKALKQRATVTKLDETNYQLRLDEKVAKLIGSDLNCACLQLTALEGIVTISYGDTVATLSPAGEAYEGNETVTKVQIPAHTRFTVTRVTDTATLHLTGTLTLEHRLTLGMLYLELVLPTMGRRGRPPYWV